MLKNENKQDKEASTGLCKKLPARHLKRKIAGRVVNTKYNTEHSPATYIEVREEASTGLCEKLPTRRDFTGIYFHWPYCLSHCPYCDFYKEKGLPEDENKLINEYLEDLDWYRDFCGERNICSIFLGGGTPSLIKPQNIERVINHIYKNWKCNQNIEISLEANPNTHKDNLFYELRQSGINRLSLGVQALNKKDLKFLGRTHSLQNALDSIDDILHNFNNQSVDLIYARPHQNLAEWEDELKLITSLGLKHLSLYQLTIEEGTFFAKKGYCEMAEDDAEKLYNFTCNYLGQKGYPRYEVSNFSPSAYESIHNKLYWEGNDYIGIGPSAHGRLHKQEKLFATTHHCQLEELTPQERAEELIIMGLRLTSGINKANFEYYCGLNFNNFINKKQLQILKEEGFLEETPHFVKSTTKGFLVLNKLIEDLCS